MCKVSNKCGHSSHLESTWKDGAVIVTNRDVLDVVRDLRGVLRHKNVAATTILALNPESGITIRSLGDGEKLLVGKVAGGGAYAHLVKMAHEDPAHLQSLVEKTAYSVQGGEKGEIPYSCITIHCFYSSRSFFNSNPKFSRRCFNCRRFDYSVVVFFRAWQYSTKNTKMQRD